MRQSEPKVDSHRPVYKRIPIGSDYVVKRTPSLPTASSTPAVNAEAERIWRHVVRTCGGDVPDEPTPQTEPPPEPTPQTEPIDLYAHIGDAGSWAFQP